MIGHDGEDHEEEPDPGHSGLLLLLSQNNNSCSLPLGALGQSRGRYCSRHLPWLEPFSSQTRGLRSRPHEASSLRHYPCREKSRNHGLCFNFVAFKEPCPPAAAAPPIHRPSSPYPDPRQLGPRSQILAARTSNYHSASLRNSAFFILISNLFVAPANLSAVATLNPSVNRTSSSPLPALSPRPLLTRSRFASAWRGAAGGTHRAGERAT